MLEQTGHLWSGESGGNSNPSYTLSCIRELQNAVERALITCEEPLVTAAHLAIPLPPEPIRPTGSPELVRPAASMALDELERKAIIDALQRTHGHKARAAELLGLTRFQLYNRLKRYHIEVSPE